MHGISGVTMRQISQRLGVSQTTPYKYFSNKEDILAAVRAAAFRRFSDRLEKVRTGLMLGLTQERSGRPISTLLVRSRAHIT